MSPNPVTGGTRTLRAELKAAGYAFIPHANNDNTRKLVTLGLVATWIILTVGISFEYAVPTEAYALLSAFVWSRFGKIQEQEAQNLDS